ncbi:MAG: cyclic nucleotide-binding domain-containing protein [Pseudanabaena sp.]|uniref:cyclic nucleotide-binding domain-containing protein n=1 Tax=Pseudanabaena mucicola TaxID=71190 RepID=UPI0025757099|nr:cyclic nucleotide-binding domain-containing protein [Pseudanabaena mucicola]MCA6572715.1 cyclic nucleotide-binding domain-containing protein [Pseudanabaena sp. M53BS1SP1A06MG]MCA6584033.1 cyclic nucleotide-binding domain-containing protein [Pseudanabaena sp. M34BS1SP1A06MG]MCA6590527.1 cyclic nucleotide-binding domain-containing protein [Pseudanabaena sp. M38BS1SP1A06MG]MCA6596144.1 cyclic nucleotide-binding domain-containing protein [Pseudanabaena sp. M046S1SP1A06QC]MCA6601823.1 cyclic nuc
MTTINLFNNAKDFIIIPAGEVIFEKGGIADYMYVVIEGEVEILIDGKFLDITSDGGIIGEMALIDSSPRSATAIAKTECKLVPVDQKRFEFLVQQTPNFSINVMKIMVERIRKLDALVVSLR